MPIRKINGSWYVDKWINVPGEGRRRIRRKSPYRTKAETVKHQDEIVSSALSISMPSENEERRFDQAFAEVFLEEYCSSNHRKLSDVETKESVFRVHLLPALREKWLNEISADDIARFRTQKLKAKLSPKTVNNMLSVLRTSLVFAKEKGWVSRVPEFKWLKVPKRRPKFLKVSEAEKLVSAADSGMWRTAVVLTLRGGLRVGEILALQAHRDVDLDEGWITIREAVSRGVVGTPKDDEEREVPLSDDAWKALREHLEGHQHRLVFCNPDGSMLTRNQARRALHRACVTAGLKPCGWHHLRRSFATHALNAAIWAARNPPESDDGNSPHEESEERRNPGSVTANVGVGCGGELTAVSAVLGHQTWDVTKRYAVPSRELMREAVGRLGSVGHYLGNGEPESGGKKTTGKRRKPNKNKNKRKRPKKRT